MIRQVLPPPPPPHRPSGNLTAGRLAGRHHSRPGESCVAPGAGFGTPGSCSHARSQHSLHSRSSQLHLLLPYNGLPSLSLRMQKREMEKEGIPGKKKKRKKERPRELQGGGGWRTPGEGSLSLTARLASSTLRSVRRAGHLSFPFLITAVLRPRQMLHPARPGRPSLSAGKLPSTASGPWLSPGRSARSSPRSPDAGN